MLVSPAFCYKLLFLFKKSLPKVAEKEEDVIPQKTQITHRKMYKYPNWSVNVKTSRREYSICRDIDHSNVCTTASDTLHPILFLRSHTVNIFYIIHVAHIYSLLLFRSQIRAT